LTATLCSATVRSTTMSNVDLNHDPSYLGDLERDVLRIVWKLAPVAADRVREELGRGHKESTVRTVLHRLEAKGYLKHTLDNRTFIYQAAKPPRHVAALAMKRIADWLCDGSMEELLLGMVDTDVVNHRQLKKLSEKVAKAQRGRK
jgi:BlaI family penicillinase repressor